MIVIQYSSYPFSWHNFFILYFLHIDKIKADGLFVPFIKFGSLLRCTAIKIIDLLRGAEELTICPLCLPRLVA